MADKDVSDSVSQRIDEFREALKKSQQDSRKAEEAIKEAEQAAQAALEEAKDAAEKTQDAEQTGNEQELEAAEEEEQDAEEKIGQAEQDEEIAEEDIEEEVQLQEKQEEIIEIIEKEAVSMLKDARDRLAKEINRLNSVRKSDQKTLTKADYEGLEETLNEFGNAAWIVDKSCELIPELMKEAQETENEQLELEKVSRKLPQEMDFMEGEVKELVADFQQLQDQKKEQYAEKEAEELSQEEQQQQQIQKEEQKVDQELKSEITEAESLITQSKELFEQMDESIKQLRELEELLNSERRIWKFALNMNPPTNDVEQTIEYMEEVLNRDRSRVDKAASLLSSIKSRLPSGIGRKAARKSASLAKYALIGGIAILGIMVALGMILAGTM